MPLTKNWKKSHAKKKSSSDLIQEIRSDNSILSQQNNSDFDFHIVECISGNFHQGSANVFQETSAGKQCTSNALLALCKLPNMSCYKQDMKETAHSLAIPNLHK